MTPGLLDKGYDATAAEVNGRTTSAPNDVQGFTKSVDGGGAIPSTFDTNRLTGQTTGMTTFAGGSIATSGGATTGWAYDPKTGFLAGRGPQRQGPRAIAG